MRVSSSFFERKKSENAPFILNFPPLFETTEHQIEKNSAVELHQTQSGVLKKKRQQNVFFVHAGRALRLVQDTFRHLFSVIKGPINKFSR